MLTIWNPPLSKAFLGNPIDVHDVCNIPEYESWTVCIPNPLTLSNLLLVAQSNMLHFNFSQESTQLLFWVVSDFALSKAAKFKSAFNLSRFQTTPTSRRKASSLKIQCTYIHVCRIIKLLTIEFRDAAGSSNGERMAMLAFSNSTWHSAMKM